MFGFSLTQLFLVCMVALVVLGPKQTVEFAYSLGRQLGRCKRFFDGCKQELDLQKIAANCSSVLKEHNDEMTLALKQAMKLNEKNLGKDQDDQAATKHADTPASTNAGEDKQLLARMADLEREISVLKSEICNRKKIS